MRLKMSLKGIGTDSSNLFLWHCSIDIDGKTLFPKFNQSINQNQSKINQSIKLYFHLQHTKGIKNTYKINPRCYKWRRDRKANES